MTNNMFLVSKSKHSFDETVEKITEAVAKADWRVIHTHNLQAIMVKNNYNDVAQTTVMEICKPSLAHGILSDEESRIYSNMLPCRISVYVQADGNTYVSRMNIKDFAGQIGGKVAEVMTQAFEGAESIIHSVV